MIFFIIICEMINWSIWFSNQFSYLIWVSWRGHSSSYNFFSCSNWIQSVQYSFFFWRILNWSLSSLSFFKSCFWTKILNFNWSWAEWTMNWVRFNLLFRSSLCLRNHCNTDNWLYWFCNRSFFKSSIGCNLKDIKSLLSKGFINSVVVSINKFNTRCFPKKGKHGNAHCNFIHY